jgi:hypothetical protein
VGDDKGASEEDIGLWQWEVMKARRVLEGEVPARCALKHGETKQSRAQVLCMTMTAAFKHTPQDSLSPPTFLPARLAPA